MAYEATPTAARARRRGARLRRRSGALGACSGRPGWRCSWLPCSPRSPSVLRRVGWRRENAAKFDDAGADAARWPIRCSRRSRAGTPSGTCASPTRATAASEARAAFFPLYPLLVRALATPFGASPAALLVAAYVVALAAFLARAGAAVPAGRRSSWAGRWPGRRCCCWRCSRPRSTSARPTRRACSCCWRWARSTRRGPAAGRGPGACAAGGGGHAQRGRAADAAAG